MGKVKSKDIVTAICITSAVITSIIIVSTFLTIYQFFYVGQMFNSYYMLQIGVCITMLLWGIRFLLYYKGRERYIYSSICIIITVVFIFFIINLVN